MTVAFTPDTARRAPNGGEGLVAVGDEQGVAFFGEEFVDDLDDGFVLEEVVVLIVAEEGEMHLSRQHSARYQF